MIFSPKRLRTIKDNLSKTYGSIYDNSGISGIITPSEATSALLQSNNNTLDPSSSYSPIKQDKLLEATQNSSGTRKTQKEDDMATTALIDDLSKQELTQKGKLRMAALTARKKLLKKQSSNANYKNNIKFDDAYFIPKRAIRRPDGASLSDVYASKKADLWGKIIKRQYEEDEYNKIIGREDKAKANTTFGNRLRDQLKDNARIRALDDGSDAKMMREVNERYARIDAEQKKRVTDARERHKQFIENALEDIETKRIQREKDLDEEMYGSSMLIEKTKYLIAEDEKKQAELKEKALVQNKILFAENEAAIKKKNDDKLADWAFVAKITAERERNERMEDDRRARELAHLDKLASDGPAHGVYRKIMKGFNQNKDDMYKTFEGMTDTISKQLKKTEDAENYRVAQLRGDGTVSKSWADMMRRQQKEREEEIERSYKFGQIMRKEDKEHWIAEGQKKKKQHDAALIYQKDLDRQLQNLRNKSMASLSKTMTDEEQNMNESLLRKYNISKQQ